VKTVGQRRRPRPSIAAVAAVAGLAGVATAACGVARSDGATQGINVSGSSTVEPISALAAEAFHERDRSANIAVDGPGTGDGFELFCDGETDISDASRPIREEEEAACARNGIDYVELLVGYDGVVVMTNVANDAVRCLDFADLYALTGPESDGVDRWSDGLPIARALGSRTDLPRAPLVLAGPGPESGTYDSYVEIVIEDIAAQRGHDATTRSDYASSSDDNVVVSTVRGNDTALGWVGFAFAEDAAATVRPLAIAAEPGAPCVDASAATIADGTYPLSRPLFIYVNTERAEQKPQLAAYVDFYLAHLDQFVAEAGYVPLPQDQAGATRAVWEGR